MKYLNRVELKGRIGTVNIANARDRRVARVSVATSTYKKVQNSDEWTSDTQWHNVTIWEDKGMPDFSLLQKGTAVYVQGTIRYSDYTDRDGITRKTLDIIAQEVDIIMPDRAAEQAQDKGGSSAYVRNDVDDLTF